MRYLFFVIGACLLLCAVNVQAAEITLKSGQILSGEIVADDLTQVTIKLPSEIEVKIPKSEVQSINYAKAKESTDFHKLQSKSEPAPLTENNKGVTTHDGFFLRLLGGSGSLEFSEAPVFTDGTGTVKMSGVAGFFGFHVGYAITENFILLVSMNGYAGSDLKPELHIPEDPALHGTKSTQTVSLGISQYGAGLSYYLMPLNMYLSTDVGATQSRFSVAGAVYESEWGLGFNGQIGKEWWISDDWGIGVAVFFHISTMKDYSSTALKPIIDNKIIGVAFSATYN